jgi:hypothetical protein
MSFETDRPIPPGIWGQERVDLVEDLARGERHAAVAEKYGRSLQAVHQFSARNSAEIAGRRRELQGELNVETAQQWVSDKAQLKDLYRKHYEDLDVRLSDPDLDDRLLVRLTREATSILHKVSDLMGWLPQRVAIESDKPLLSYEIVGLDMDKVFAEGGRQHTWNHVPASDSDSEPAPESSDATSDRNPESAPAPEPKSPSTPEDRAYVRWLNS